MSRGARRLLVGLAAGVVAIGVVTAIVVSFAPPLLRTLAISRIEAATGRAASIDTLDLDLWRGTLAVRGLRLADRDGDMLATIGRLDARIAWRALLTGHLWVRELAIEDSTVRVVRFENGEVNISDMIRRGGGGGGPGLGVTVDRFSLAGGTVVLEDRSVSPVRVWKSEDLAIVASHVSTRRDDGEAEASSTIDGAPVSVRVEQLRLVPVHLRAVVRARQVDLSLARIYFPASTPVLLDRGRLDTTVTVALDARTGVRVDADGRVTDVRLVRRHHGDLLLAAPAIRVAVRGFSAARDGALAVGRVELEGAATLVNGDARPPARFDLPRVTVRADGLAWPVQGPAKVELRSPVPGGGQVTVRGDVTPQPPSADVDVRMTRVNLAPWGRYVAPWVRVAGTGEVALKVRAQLHPTLAATGRGVARVDGVVVDDGGRRLLAVAQAEASGLDLAWPSRVTVDRVRLRRPTATLERDASGAIVIPGLTPRAGETATAGVGGQPRPAASSVDARPQPSPSAPAGVGGPSASTSAASRLRPTFAVNRVEVDDGALTWRDLGTKAPATIRLARVSMVATDAAWPMSGPVRVRARAATPGGGAVEVTGRVGLEPVVVEARAKARGVALAPFAAYVPTALPIQGYADATLSATLSRAPDLEVTVRGSAGVSRLSVADGKRRVLTAGRVEARGLDVDWPERVRVERLAVWQPWVLVERDEQGAFPLRAMLRWPGARSATPGTSATSDAAPADPSPSAGAANGERRVPPVTVGELIIEGGGARVVDRAVSPPYAEDLSRVRLRVRSVETASHTPAKVDLRATVGQAGVLLARGTVGPFGDALSLDVTGETRDLPVSRLNPYLEHFVGWKATSGRLSTRIVCRLNTGDLRAANEIHLGRLQVVRAGRDDAARERLGLPLGLIVGLLKDGRGDITLSLPVGGNVNDGGLDFSEAIWSAVRAVAIRTIALPVSWIGRLRVSADSKIQDIDIDPLEFEPGTATVAAAAAPRLERITAFMRRLPDVKMILTPVISLGDIEALKARAIASRLEKVAAERKGDEIEAARVLYAEKFDGAPPPDLGDIVAALREVEEPPAAAAADLARSRTTAVRQALERSDIERARLTVNKDAGALDTLDAGRVEFGVTDEVKPRRTLADLLRGLLDAFRRRLAAARETR
jgi:hypothetical protein